MSISKIFSAATSASGVVLAEGVDFDGVTDYLSRSSDLTGNVDSKTFTFSCWVYLSANNIVQRLFQSSSGHIDIFLDTAGSLKVQFYNSAGTAILYATGIELKIPTNTFTHYLISVDLTSTSNRKIYINDVLATVTWTTYTNGIIDFTDNGFFIACSNALAQKIKGRLSHLYLDYTYRDLSIEANRMLFITADGKPTPTATLKALNPILYLPMKDAATAHINEGTGGNFVQNGTLNTASRGANQDNCKASYFDGSADYLSRAKLTGIADGKVFTSSCILSNKSTEASGYPATAMAMFKPLGNQVVLSLYSIGDTGGINITAQKTDGTLVIVSLPAGTVSNRNSTVHVSCSIDIGTNVFVVFVNGINKTASATFTNANNLNIIFSQTVGCISGGNYTTPSVYYIQTVGELYFDTKYIDLATSNPFWDSVAKRPKPVRQVIADTGITPLIAMPLDASNAGKNYGTGGDFTANSAPYVGARGASEFWARSAKSNGTTGYLSRNSIGASNSLTFTFVFGFYYDLSGGDNILFESYTDGNNYFELNRNGTAFQFVCLVGGSAKLIATDINGFIANSFNTVTLSFDMSSKVNSKAYVNSVQKTINFDTFVVGTLLPFNSNITHILKRSSGSYFKGAVSSLYFTTSYIDFSQEVNRNKFVDQLGYPKDLKAQIDAGVIPTPLIYLPFDDTSNLGKNLGTGGDFTVNGTVTAGADFSL